MMALWLWVLFIIALFLILLAIFIWLLGIRPRLRALPAMPKPPSDCSLPAYPPGVNPPRLTDPPPPPLGGNVTGGFFTGSTLVVPAGTSINLTSTLVLIAAGNLRVDGIIQPGKLPAGGAPVDIVLVSLEKDVIIGAQAGVGFGGGPSGIPSTATGWRARASGGGAAYGGVVKLIALRGSIRVDGTVAGEQGGAGGNAIANGTAVAPAIGGTAWAVGGEGGEGGDVRLCAYESIGIPGLVIGSEGGQGGYAEANGANSKDGYAQGGPGNKAGTVYFQGLAPTPCQVFIPGQVRAHPGGRGGKAVANGGGPGSFSGGEGAALGGDGQQGGTVLFTSCFVIPPFGPVKAGIGGDGGDAEGNGGAGAGAIFFGGWSGGEGIAEGGRGGTPPPPPNNPPQIPTPTGIVPGIPAAQLGAGWSSGKGGDADATGGNGGTGGWRGAGGTSGGASAQGGVSGNTGVPGAKSSAAGVAGGPAPAGVGGVGPSVTSTGAP